jgi:hypothetical protein
MPYRADASELLDDVANARPPHRFGWCSQTSFLRPELLTNPPDDGGRGANLNVNLLLGVALPSQNLDCLDEGSRKPSTRSTRKHSSPLAMIFDVVQSCAPRRLWKSHSISDLSGQTRILVRVHLVLHESLRCFNISLHGQVPIDNLPKLTATACKARSQAFQLLQSLSSNS